MIQLWLFSPPISPLTEPDSNPTIKPQCVHATAHNTIPRGGHREDKMVIHRDPL